MLQDQVLSVLHRPVAPTARARASRAVLAAAALIATAFWAARAQDDIGARLKEASRALASANTPIGRLDEAQRERVVEFVAGNTLFTLSHEFGHTLVSDFNLPVLGREEDAVDSFATLALLHVGSDFTHRVLVDAARGLLRVGERDLQAGAMPVFYGEHGLDQQRAYAIVCLMVGADPVKFKDLAEKANLPEERRETCQGDFDRARTSWTRLLEPHLRDASRPSLWERLTRPRSGASEKPASSVAVAYGDATGELAPYRDLLRTVRLLEVVGDFVSRNFNLPRRLTLEAKSCGEPNAHWDPRERRIVFCYELLPFYADLAPRS